MQRFKRIEWPAPSTQKIRPETNNESSVFSNPDRQVTPDKTHNCRKPHDTEKYWGSLWWATYLAAMASKERNAALYRASRQLHESCARERQSKMRQAGLLLDVNTNLPIILRTIRRKRTQHACTFMPGAEPLLLFRVQLTADTMAITTISFSTRILSQSIQNFTSQSNHCCKRT